MARENPPEALAIDPERLSAIVREVLRELEVASSADTAASVDGRVVPSLPVGSSQQRGDAAAADAARVADGAAAAAATASAERTPLMRPRRPRTTTPFATAERARIVAASPARLVQGRVGTRYPTDKAIGLRAEHAVALDAVNSVLPDDFATQLGCLALRTQAADHADYLAYPEKGRRLDAESRALVEQHGTRGVDVQVIAGDGLAAWALIANGPELMPALEKALGAGGFSVGKPMMVRHARIGVADEIGVLLGCKATVMLVGERPGLGTGDSLSIYTAFGPKLQQDNAEKDCISNIRPLGIPTQEAATMCVALLRRTFDAGGGGVHMTKQGDAA
jgi:ethanolamine ammonia-lyase small subunit